MNSSNALNNACQKGKLKKVKEILERNPTDVNVNAGVFGFTPLHEATSSGRPDIIELLLEKGANVDSKSNGKYTPLHIAATIGDLKCIEVLLRYNADLRQEDEFGKSPHKTAEVNKQRKAARLLKTEEVKKAIENNREFGKTVENIQPGVDVTLNCFNECLVIAVKRNYHFAAGFISLREPDNMLESLKECLSTPSSKETAAMLLACTAASKGDCEILQLLFCAETKEQISKQNVNAVILRRDFLPNKEMSVADMIDLGEAANGIDHAFPVSMACSKKKFKAVNILLFMETYVSPLKKEADWHGLALSVLKEECIEKIITYKKLNLGWNHLTRLPSNMNRLANLVRLNLQKNRLQNIPGYVFTLPALRNLNLSGNLIQKLPIVEWSPSLNILDLKDNLLITFPENIKGATIEYLNIANNKLETFPLGICSITTLRNLDISDNKDIRELPIELGYLSKLVDFTFKGLVIKDPPTNVQRPAKTLISHLRARLRAAEPYYCMKLLIIGQAAQGKTTLMHRLKGDVNYSDDISTQGIDIQEIKLPRKAFGNQQTQFTFRVWDFAGQDDYYATHQCFLSRRSLYLLIWDSQELSNGVNGLKLWLDNLTTRVPGATIIVIGTMLDKVPPGVLQKNFVPHMREAVENLFTSDARYYKINLAGVEFVSSNVKYKDYSKMMEGLRQLIYQVASEMEYCDPRNGKPTGDLIMGEKIPHSYRLFEDRLRERQREKAQETKGIPILMRDEFMMLAKESPNNNEKDRLHSEDIADVTKFLHNIGTILHYNDPNYDLKDMYFINPSWLCRLMSKIITVDAVHARIKNGILSIDDLKNFIIRDDIDFPNMFYNRYLRLLFRFQIACPIDSNRVLVPSKLPEGSARIVKEPAQTTLLIRRHTFHCIPFGFWERFVSRLLLFMRDMLVVSSSKKTLDHVQLATMMTSTKAEDNSKTKQQQNVEDLLHQQEDEDEDEEDTLNLSINQPPKAGIVYVNADTNMSPPPQDDEGSPNLPFRSMLSLNGVEYDENSTSTSAMSTVNSDVSSTIPSLGSIYQTSHDETSSVTSGTFSSYGSRAPSLNPNTSSDTGHVQDDAKPLSSSLDEESESQLTSDGERCSPEPPNEMTSSSPLQSSVSMITVIDLEASENETSPCMPQPSEVIDKREKEFLSQNSDIDVAEMEDSLLQEEENNNNNPLILTEERIDETNDGGVTNHIGVELLNETTESTHIVNDEKTTSSGNHLQYSPSLSEEDSPNETFEENPRDPVDMATTGESSKRTHYSESDEACFGFQKPSKEQDFCEVLNEFPDISHLFDQGIITCWKTGIIFDDPKLFFSVRKLKNKYSSSEEIIETKVSNSSIGHRVLGYIIDHIRTLIKEWYPGLSGNDGERAFVNQFAACPVCIQLGIRKPYMFDIKDAFAKIYIARNGDKCLSCEAEKRHSPQVVDVEQLCPELLFKDLSEDLQIARSKLEFEENEDYLIGNGAFGKVYRGNYIISDDKQIEVAIKFYNFEDYVLSAQDVFHDIRQEIFVLSKLREHKFIVRFVGFLTEPRLSALMELACHGNLKDALYDQSGKKKEINRVVLFRVVKQIASALDFMHKRRIIHRDIKSDNILVFQIDHQTGDIHIKLTDFGTANFLTPDGMKFVAGTPGFMAPEMFEFISSDEYTIKVDIYSFAMVIGEMINGRRPFHDIQYEHQIPQALRDRDRPSYVDTKESLYGLLPLTDLMTKMWKHESTKRPTAHQVLTQSQHPAFQLFYGKRTLEPVQNPKHLCAVPSTHNLWAVCDHLSGVSVIILNMKTSEVKTVWNIDGQAYGMDSYNPMHVVLITETHIAITLLGTADDQIRIFTTDGKNPSHEVIEDNHIKAMAVHKDHVYVGYQSGQLGRVTIKNFLKGKLTKEGVQVLINQDRPVMSMVFNEKYVIASSGGYVYQYPCAFVKDEKTDRLKRLHHQQRILDMKLLSDGENFVAQFQCASEVQIVNTNSLEVLQKIDVEDKVRELKPNCDPWDHRVWTLCPAHDTLWLGMGSGHIFIYDISDPKNKTPELLTYFQPYKFELRKLCLWKNDTSKDLYGVEYIMASTGKELNDEAFGFNPLCKLTTDFPPFDERISDKKDSITSSTASFSEEVERKKEEKMERKTMLFWYAPSAKLLRNLLLET
eukprot:TCONS_00056027-protein